MGDGEGGGSAARRRVPRESGRGGQPERRRFGYSAQIGQVFRAWRSGQAVLPTTLVGVATCLSFALIGIRLTDVFQLAVALPTGVSRSPSPILDLSLACVWMVETVTLLYFAAGRGGLNGSRWGLIDTATACLVLLSEPVFTRESERVGTWAAWGFAIGVAAAFTVGLCDMPRRTAALCATALAASYAVVSLPAALQHAGEMSTVIANTIAFYGFVVFPRIVAGYLRRLGRDADCSRELAAASAAAAARRVEIDRSRSVLHDPATTLSRLSEPPSDPASLRALQQQAGRDAIRIRRYLAAAVADPRTGPGKTLDALVRQVAADFLDLPLELNVTLGRAALLSLDQWGVLEQALVTVLSDVRRHAVASEVVVHADVRGDEWELTVRDNGVGFDPAVTIAGFGTSVTLGRLLPSCGIRATRTSAPGAGTRVEFRGLCASGSMP